MKQTILGLQAATSIHAGSGQNNGVIDRPIQREVHTGYPCVYGSAVKGAFRAHAEVRVAWGKGAKLNAVFGASDTDGSTSNINMTDARLLLLPVRSLTGHFKLVTCPAILKRFERDRLMMGFTGGFDIPSPKAQQVIGDAEDSIFLEEFKFSQIKGLPDKLMNALKGLGADENLDKQLLVMNDDDFSWFAKNSTAIAAHIAIESETKTVKPGALWYEETLPADSLLYTMIFGKKKYVDDVLGMFEENKNFVQIGGNETVGMGWCKVATL